jgi:hypothetical protein
MSQNTNLENRALMELNKQLKEESEGLRKLVQEWEQKYAEAQKRIQSKYSTTLWAFQGILWVDSSLILLRCIRPDRSISQT